MQIMKPVKVPAKPFSLGGGMPVKAPPTSKTMVATYPQAVTKNPGLPINAIMANKLMRK